MLKTTKKIETLASEIIARLPERTNFDEKIAGTKADLHVTDKQPSETIFTPFLFEGKEYYICAK